MQDGAEPGFRGHRLRPARGRPHWLAWRGVALTDDPKLDDLALIDALQSDAFYVGAIGSRRNTAQRRQRLREHFDLSEPALQSLHGPAGLYIASKTPAEIALSIMAEVVAVKNGLH